MSRLVYACRFEIGAGGAYEDSVARYKNWIEQHYRQRRGIKNFALPDEESAAPQIADSLPGHVVSKHTIQSGSGEVTIIHWSYPSDQDSTLIWRNEIRIGQVGGVCSVEHPIWVDSSDYRVTPPKIFLGSPAIIRELCATNVVRVGDMTVRASPYHLELSGVPDFISLLGTPLRRLPFVFVSPYAGGDTNLLDSVDLARRLAGVAVVVETHDPECTWEIAEELGRQMSCFDGAARIYWPGFAKADHPKRHPLYLSARIESYGADSVARAIEHSVFAIAAYRFVPDARISAVISVAEERLRQERLAASVLNSGTNWEGYALELDGKLSEALQRVSELTSELENVRANQQVLFEPSIVGETEVAADDPPTPSTVSDAVKWATKNCSHLVVLESAVKAAAKSPFRRPGEVLAALSDLQKVSEEWARRRNHGDTGMDIRKALVARGWGKRCSFHIADTTKAKFESDYTFEYNGSRILFEPHITIGSGDANSCASIHFLPDAESGKIVVAHVGRHLRNTKT